MLSVANCCPPIECRHPETEIGKPLCVADRMISASSSLVCGLRSSRTRVRLSCEWTSLTQIAFSSSANACGASAKSAAVRMNSRRVTIARDYRIQLDSSETNYLASGDGLICISRFHFPQIIVIEKSNYAPRLNKLGKFTSRSSPEERFAPSAQPPISKRGLRVESNVTI